MLNAMMYVRGNSKDYDEWESLGNPGWGWDQVRPYFQKSERLHGDYQDWVDPKFHGTSGRLHVMVPQKVEGEVKGADIVDLAAEELGFKHGDLNGHAQVKCQLLTG